MNIVVVGAGMIGQERIKAIERLGENIIAVVDPNATLSQLADYPCYKQLPELTKCEWVFVCTPHDITCNIVKKAIKAGCNVLAEKPLGRTLYECELINTISASQKINVGFNYRFYKGVNLLLQDIKNNVFGDLISVNMVLGLSNKPGTEKTWRLDPERAGSGSIIYAGIHLIDLVMLISKGTLIPVAKAQWTGFWKTNIEEEIHLIAIDHKRTIYNIQSSIDRWRSTFRIEVNGTEGYGIVEGRNRYYGNQTYIRGKRWGWMTGKTQRGSEELIVDYDGEDSFFEETKAVLYGCSGIQPATKEDNRKCLDFIERL